MLHPLPPAFGEGALQERSVTKAQREGEVSQVSAFGADMCDFSKLWWFKIKTGGEKPQ